MQINAILSHLNAFAPPQLQEDYDNARLIVGDAGSEATGVLVSLDSTEDVIDEAIRRNCNLVVAHHPILFGKRNSITGRDYVERTIIKAIKNDVAIFSIHTNLDNVKHGVNAKICEVLGIQNPRILAPKPGRLNKLAVFVPSNHAEGLRKALFAAGAGQIGNYDECSFNMPGEGTFRPNESAKPVIGEVGKRETADEVRLEVLVEDWKISKVLEAMRSGHPYEEVAYDLYPLANVHQDIGSGMVGELSQAMPAKDFLLLLKERLKAGVVRHTDLVTQEVKRVAVCGGSGSFLLEQAVRSGADIFVTADYKYHQFFDADGRIIIADVGHYESEQFTSDLLVAELRREFPNFAVHLSETDTNPVNYV